MKDKKIANEIYQIFAFFSHVRNIFNYIYIHSRYNVLFLWSSDILKSTEFLILEKIK